MIDFAGRTAFVTGGANGVGIGIVRNLLNEGAKVAIADIRQDAIDAALASLDNREVMGVQLNVMDREGFRDAADKVEAEMANDGPGKSLKMGTFGIYEDQLRKVEGRWLFSERRILNEFLPGRESGPGNPVLATEESQ